MDTYIPLGILGVLESSGGNKMKYGLSLILPRFDVEKYLQKGSKSKGTPLVL